MQDIWRDSIIPLEKYSAFKISNKYFSKYKMRGDGQRLSQLVIMSCHGRVLLRSLLLYALPQTAGEHSNIYGCTFRLSM